MQGSPALVRRRHRRIGSSASLDSRSSQPSPLKRGDLTASLPAVPSTSLRGNAPEGTLTVLPLTFAQSFRPCVILPEEMLLAAAIEHLRI